MDDIIKMYLKDDKEDGSNKSASPLIVDDVVKMYLKDKAAEPEKSVAPKPPISGVNKEASDEINSQVSKVGGENPRPGIGSVPVKAGQAIYDAAKSGVLTAASGIGDTLSGKPASGLGKVGMGLMGVVSSPAEGASSIAGDLTGSKDIADRAGFVASALPVAKLAEAGRAYLPVRMPTVSNPNPIASPPVAREKALDVLVNAITAEGKKPGALAETVAAMKADPRVGPADTSPNVLALAQDLYAKDNPAAKSHLFDASKGRVANLKNDTSAAFNEAGGVPVDAVNKLRDLAVASKKVGEERINPARSGAGPVDLSGVLDHIDNITKPGILKNISGESTLPYNAVKKAAAETKAMMANSKEQMTDANSLHWLQSGLRVKGEALLKSTSGEEKQVGLALLSIRNKIVEAIDKASPKDATGKGTYAPALAGYRDEKHIAEAFHDAYNGVFSNSTKLENRPEFTKEWYNSLTAHEKAAAKEGARLAIDSKIGAAQNGSLAGTNLGRSDFNQKKMEILFGKEETEKLLRNLENTRAIKHVDNKITEGSDTAVRLSNKEGTKLSKDDPKAQNGLSKYAVPAIGIASEIGGQFAGLGGGMGGAIGTGASLAALAAGKAVSKVHGKVVDALEQERNHQLAKMMLPVGEPSRQQLIRDLESRIPGPKQSMLSRIRLPIAP